MAHTLTHRGTSQARASVPEVGTTITAVLDDGPLRGKRIDAVVVEGRPPSTVDVPDDDGTCRYCLAQWVSGWSMRAARTTRQRLLAVGREGSTVAGG